MPDDKRPILEHLEELRKRILISLLAVVLLSVLSYTYSKKILEYLARYASPLVFISPEEAFVTYLKISFFSGLILSMPIILYNAFRFIWVALNKKEKELFTAYLAAGIFLFIAGGCFANFIALPAGIKFLLSFSSETLKPLISVSRYVSFSAFLILAFAVSFETPIIVVFLTRLGVLNSRVLREKRRYSIVLIFIVAAVLTPPDVITQILLAIPLLFLYELSIFSAKLTEKRQV